VRVAKPLIRPDALLDSEGFFFPIMLRSFSLERKAFLALRDFPERLPPNPFDALEFEGRLVILGSEGENFKSLKGIEEIGKQDLQI
jgi:hypothetical protein